MGHNFQLRIAAHNRCYDGYRSGAFGQRHLGVRTIAVGHVFHLVAVAGDIDKRWLELHQRVDAVIESGDVAAFQGWHQLEAGKRML